MATGFATTELRILMQEVVLLTLRDWGKHVDLTLYVDDLTVETDGNIADAAGRNAAAVDEICRILQEDMDFDVSEKEYVVVASDPGAAVLTASLSQSGKISANDRGSDQSNEATH